VPKPLLSTFFHIPERSIALVNDWLVHQKELKLIPTCPTLTKCYSKVAHAFLYTLMDSFSRTKLCPSRCYLTFFHIPERSIALVKRLAGSPKGAEIDPNLPHASESSKVAHAFLYTWIFFQSHQPARCCYLTFFHIPERSIALVKRLAGSPKGAEIDPNLPHANKSVTQGSTRILIYIDGSFSRTKLCPSCCYLTFFHIPERSIALVKRLAGSPKELKLIPTCPTLTKVLLQGSTRILIYMDGLLSVAPNCAQAVAIFLLPYSRTFNCTSKTTGWFTKGAEIDPNLPHAKKSVTPR
jgi:hypothetical protein